MKTVKKGRPPMKEKRHDFWLTTSTLRSWNERRKAFGLKNKSNSEFAEVLLHGMFLKRTGRFDCPDNNNNKGAQRTLVVGGPLTKCNNQECKMGLTGLRDSLVHGLVFFSFVIILLSRIHI